MKYFLVILISSITLSLSAQSLKTMTPETFNIWNTIKETRISNDGQYVVYNVGNESGDPTLHVYSHATGNTIRFHRGSKPQISADNQWLVFKLSASKDTVRQLKWLVYKKEAVPLQPKKKMTDDTTKTKAKKPKKPKKEDGTLLVFYDLKTRNTVSYPGVLKYKIAKKEPSIKQLLSPIWIQPK